MAVFSRVDQTDWEQFPPFRPEADLLRSHLRLSCLHAYLTENSRRGKHSHWETHLVTGSGRVQSCNQCTCHDSSLQGKESVEVGAHIASQSTQRQSLRQLAQRFPETVEPFIIPLHKISPADLQFHQLKEPKCRRSEESPVQTRKSRDKASAHCSGHEMHIQLPAILPYEDCTGPALTGLCWE